MTEIKINPSQKAIILTSKFSKKALCVGTAEYFQLQEVHKDYPNFEIQTRTIKKKQGKESYKGLTYEYMEKYINAVDDTGLMIMVYNTMRFRSGCHSVRFAKIKDWFLKNFPEVNNFTLERTKDLTLEQVQEWIKGNVA